MFFVSTVEVKLRKWHGSMHCICLRLLHTFPHVQYIHKHVLVSRCSVLWQLVCSGDAEGLGRRQTYSVSGVSLSLSPSFWGHTHQTWPAPSVLSLSSALNGHSALMWPGCCSLSPACLDQCLLIWWGHENKQSRCAEPGWGGAIVSGAIFNQLWPAAHEARRAFQDLDVSSLRKKREYNPFHTGRNPQLQPLTSGFHLHWERVQICIHFTVKWLCSCHGQGAKLAFFAHWSNLTTHSIDYFWWPCATCIFYQHLAGGWNLFWFPVTGFYRLQPLLALTETRQAHFYPFSRHNTTLWCELKFRMLAHKWLFHWSLVKQLLQHCAVSAEFVTDRMERKIQWNVPC